MDPVAESMHFKNDCVISDVNGDAASIIKSGTHQTIGQDSLCLVTSRDLRMNLPHLRHEFNRLKMHLLEILPDDTTFKFPALQEDVMDDFYLPTLPQQMKW